MLREVDLKEISDGRLYGLNDMVKADCQDCTGCSSCCRGMGTSVVLDPLDMHRLSVYLGMTPAELLSPSVAAADGSRKQVLELNVVDGVILPNLAMTGEKESCPFLDKDGRCSVHPARTGICRIFPLGRYYEEETKSFRYFLQIHECSRENRTKVKVKKWIDVEQPAKYDEYIVRWHYFLKRLQGEQPSQEVCMYLLREFFLRPYSAGKQTSPGQPFAAAFYDEFYREFYERLEQAEEKTN